MKMRFERWSAALVGFLLLGASSAQADLPWGLLPDYNASLGARSTPLSGSVTGEIGAGKVLWGERKPGDFRYGYLRGAAKLRTSILSNRPELSLRFFPISLFGVTVGYGLSQRGTNGFAAECTSGAAACMGMLGAAFGQLTLKAGYAGFFFSGEATWSRFTPSDTTLPFYDETSSLVGTLGGDTGFSTSFALGRGFSPHWMGGLALTTDAMLGNSTGADFEGAFANYHEGAWSYTAVLGTYRSSTISRGVAGFAQIKWTGLGSIEL